MCVLLHATKISKRLSNVYNSTSGIPPPPPVSIFFKEMTKGNKLTVFSYREAMLSTPSWLTVTMERLIYLDPPRTKSPLCGAQLRPKKQARSPSEDPAEAPAVRASRIGALNVEESLFNLI